MTLETFLIWLVIGLIAGWLASVVAGGGFGLLGDIIVGVVGAFIGGFIFRGLHVHVPWRADALGGIGPTDDDAHHREDQEVVRCTALLCGCGADFRCRRGEKTELKKSVAK